MSHSKSAPIGSCASSSTPSATVILGPQTKSKSLTHPALPLVLLSDVKICDKDPVYSLRCLHQKYGNMTEKENKKIPLKLQNVIYYVFVACKLRAFTTRRIKLLIVQQIVTLSKYGHDSLNICHP